MPNTARAAQRGLKDSAVPEAREVQDLVLAVENPVATLPKSSATGEYFTTKANPERHGLGLQSARRIAQQHDGCLLTELKGSCFRATAMLSTEIRSGS